MKSCQAILILTMFLLLVSTVFGQQTLLPINGVPDSTSYSSSRVTKDMVIQSNKKGYSLFHQPEDGVWTRFNGKNGIQYEFFAISDPVWKRIIVNSAPVSQDNFLNTVFNEKGKRVSNLKLLSIRGTKIHKPTGLDLRHYEDSPNEAWLAIADKGPSHKGPDGLVHLCKIKFKPNGKFSIEKVCDFTGLQNPSDVALDVYENVINIFVCDEDCKDLIWIRYDENESMTTLDQIEVTNPRFIVRTSEKQSNNGYFVYNGRGNIAFFKMDYDSLTSESYYRPNVIKNPDYDSPKFRGHFFGSGRGIPLPQKGGGPWHSILVPATNERGFVTVFLTKGPDEESLSYDNAQIESSDVFDISRNVSFRSRNAFWFKNPRAIFHSSQPENVLGPLTDERHLGEIYVLESYGKNSGFWKLNLSSFVQPLVVELNSYEEGYLRKGYVEIIKPLPIIPKRYEICVDSTVIVSGTWENQEDPYYSNPGISRIYLDDLRRTNEINEGFLYDHEYSKFTMNFYYDQFYKPYRYDLSNGPDCFYGGKEQVVSMPFSAGKIDLKDTDQVENVKVRQSRGIDEKHQFYLSWKHLRTGNGANVQRYQVRWKSVNDAAYNTRFTYGMATEFDIKNDPGFKFHEPTEFWVRGIGNDGEDTPPSWENKVVSELPTFAPDSISFEGCDLEGNYIFRVYRHQGDRAEKINLHYRELRSDNTPEPLSGFGASEDCFPGEAFTNISAGIVIAHRPSNKWEMRATTTYGGVESEAVVKHFSFQDYTSEGSVSTHEIWHAEESDGSPKVIHITGPLTIEKTGRILVERGARIVFDPDASLTIHGEFKCVGTKWNQITFESSTDGVRFGKIIYEGVDGREFKLENTSIEGCEGFILRPPAYGEFKVGDLPKINYCRFYQCGDFDAAIQVLGREVSIYDNEISSPSGFGIYMYNAGGFFDKNRILNASRSGIYLQNCHGMIVSNNTVKECDLSGIDLNDCFGITLADNWIQNCGKRGDATRAGVVLNNSSPWMHSNTIIKNMVQGIYCINGSNPVLYQPTNTAKDTTAAFNTIIKNMPSEGKGEITIRGNGDKVFLKNGHNNIYNPSGLLINEIGTNKKSTLPVLWDISGNYFASATAEDFESDSYRIRFNPQDDSLNLPVSTFADSTINETDEELLILGNALRYEKKKKYGFASIEYKKLLEKYPHSSYVHLALDRYLGNRIRLHGYTQWTIPSKDRLELETIIHEMSEFDQAKAYRTLDEYKLSQKDVSVLQTFEGRYKQATTLTDSVFSLINYFDAVFQLNEYGVININESKNCSYGLAEFPESRMEAIEVRDELLKSLER